jgi:hypothetical protein
MKPVGKSLYSQRGENGSMMGHLKECSNLMKHHQTGGIPEDSKSQPEPFEMMFTARWNVPQAAEAMGLPASEDSWEEVKQQFRQWAVSRPIRYGSHGLPGE